MTDLAALTATELAEHLEPCYLDRVESTALSELVRRASECDQAVRERDEWKADFERRADIADRHAARAQQATERADRLAAALEQNEAERVAALAVVKAAFDIAGSDQVADLSADGRHLLWALDQALEDYEPIHHRAVEARAALAASQEQTFGDGRKAATGRRPTKPFMSDGAEGA